MTTHAGDILYSHADSAPSPSKDYFQIVVTKNQVIFRSWKISLRERGKIQPEEVKRAHDAFFKDENLQGEITKAFGRRMLDNVRCLISGSDDRLTRLSRPILVRILSLLDLSDIRRMSAVSKQFREICKSDDLWVKLFLIHNGRHLTKELSSVAGEIGWKQLFYTSKLQLRMLLRRQTKYSEIPSDVGCEGDAVVEASTLAKKESLKKGSSASSVDRKTRLAGGASDKRKASRR